MKEKLLTFSLASLTTLVIVWGVVVVFGWGQEYLGTKQSPAYESVPFEFKLKAEPQDVIYSEAYQKNGKEEVRYAYITSVVEADPSEDISRRTPDSKTEVLKIEQNGTEKTETLKTVFYSKPQFYNDEGVWRQIEYATTTPEIFAASGAIRYVQKREWFERILPGKEVFAQTSTFRPDANVETSSVDGAISSSNTSNDTVIAACDAARSGSTYSTNDTGVAISPLLSYTTTDNPPLLENGGEDVFDCQYQRGFFTFDTSSLPDGATIESATMSLYGQNKVGDDSSGITTANPSSNTALANGDWTSVGGSFISATKSFGGFSTSAYNDFVFNSSGEAHINKTGVTETAYRLSQDVLGITLLGTNDTDYFTVYSADQTGTTQDPELEVVYTNNTFSIGFWFPF